MPMPFMPLPVAITDIPPEGSPIGPTLTVVGGGVALPPIIPVLPPIDFGPPVPPPPIIPVIPRMPPPPPVLPPKQDRF
jgi:hypothetical protein